MKARVYLSTDNFGILDRQLQETYGETIQDLHSALPMMARSEQHFAFGSIHVGGRTSPYTLSEASFTVDFEAAYSSSDSTAVASSGGALLKLKAVLAMCHSLHTSPDSLPDCAK
jgi:hypothetical protein